MSAADERQLTTGKGWNVRPSFAPDGSRVAFSMLDDEDRYRIAVVPAAGGDAAIVSPDSLSLLVIGWAPDKQGFFAMGLPDERVRLIGPDGAVRETYKQPGLSGIVATALDAPRFLMLRFRGDNYDMGIYEAETDSFRFVSRTEEWEVDGCMGPDAGSVTAVVRDAPTASDSRVAVYRGETERPEYLAIEPARIYTPSWSSSGRFLAYASDLNGDKDLWVYDRVAERTLQITAGTEDDLFPTWSPDDRELAFARRSANANIHVVDARTMEVTRLTSGDRQDRFPVVSPDGTHVAFVHMLPRSEGERAGEADLCIVPVGGGEVRRLRIDGLSTMGQDAAFSWSPDGTQIAFAAAEGSGESDLYRVALTDGVPVRVTLSAGSELAPVWSPDGRTLSYTRVAGGQTHVWVVPANGGLSRQISFADALCQYGIWSEDGARLCYSATYQSGLSELRVSSASSPDQGTVIYAEADPAYPAAWTAEGDGVLVWKRGEDRYTVWFVPVSGGPSFEIGRPMGTSGAARHVIKFTEFGERYRDRIYPAGLAAYADGDHVSEIFVVRVADLLKREFGKPASRETS